MERSHIDILRRTLIVKKKTTLERGGKIYNQVLKKVFSQLNTWILRARVEYLITYDLLEKGSFCPYQGDVISLHNTRDYLLVTISKDGNHIKGHLWYSYVYYQSQLFRDYLENRWEQKKIAYPCPHVYYLCDTLEYYQLVIEEYFLWRDMFTKTSSSSPNTLIESYQEKVNYLSQELDALQYELEIMVQNTQTTIEEISELQTLYKRTLDSMHLYVDIINLLSSKVE